MKTIELGLVLTFIFLPSINAQNLVKKEYDRFSKTTTIIGDPAVLYNRGENPEKNPVLLLSINCKGETVNQSTIENIYFGFICVNKKWRYLDNYDVRCLADDSVVVIPKMTRNGDVLEGGDVNEVIWTKISYDILKILEVVRKLRDRD